MNNVTRFFVSSQTRPTTIAKTILIALDRHKNIEIIPASSDVMPRVTEGMKLAKCKGEFIPDGENGKMYISCSA